VHGQQKRTYYVAADEVDWDYAPSGRDEAMGQPFDSIAKGYTEPGPIASAASTRRRSTASTPTIPSRR